MEKPIKRAIISVFDKTGVVDFARQLQKDFGIEILSTGGTAKTLQEAGIPIKKIEIPANEAIATIIEEVRYLEIVPSTLIDVTCLPNIFPESMVYSLISISSTL